MAQKSVQSADYNFRVENVPSLMTLPNGSIVKDGFRIIRRTDNYQVLGKCTERYGTIQNDDLINAAEDAFKIAGLANFKRRIVVMDNGARLYATYDFIDRTRALKIGDKVGLRLVVQNSFDGSLRASFLAALMRLACLNGMVSPEKEVGMTKKHGTQISVAFVAEALQRALALFDSSLTVFDRIATVRISQSQGELILAHLNQRNIVSGRVHEGILNVWNAPTFKEDAERNLYNLYNAVTQYLTHEVEGTRFELAKRVNESVLNTFERAARDASRLAKLLTPLPVVIEA